MTTPDSLRHEIPAANAEGAEGMEYTFKSLYGSVDSAIRMDLVERVGDSLADHVSLVEEFGITKISGLFSTEQVGRMQEDIEGWRATKSWNKDRHMTFDGISDEAYLRTSVSLSEAVTDPTILSVVAASFGQHPKMSFVRTYSVDPIEPYFRRAFQWHHDGHSEYGYKVMILLSDVPEDGQAMIFCPGTNKHQWPVNTSKETQFDDQFADSFDQYVCSGKAGDVFVFNPHSLHRGTRNNTLRRDVIVANFQPGIARNYPLPGLHPSVVSQLSPYQRAVYRTGELSYEPVQEELFVPEMLKDREVVSRLAMQWELPVEQIRDGLANDTDDKIRRMGQMNSIVLPRTPVYAENVEPGAATNFHSQVILRSQAFKELAQSASPDVRDLLERLRGDIEKEWQTDIHGDLDLPIRLYHPNRDQRRDSAVALTRDQETDVHLAELSSRLRAVVSNKLADVELGSYPYLVNDIVDAKQRLRDDILPFSTDPAVKSKLDGYVCFAEDLQSMLSYACSVPSVRKTLLFSYLTRVKIEELYGSRHLSSPLASSETALLQYAAFVFFDKLTHTL